MGAMRSLTAVAAGLGLWAATCGGCRAPAVPRNLLATAPPRAVGVANPQRSTDGVLAVEGDGWDTNLTARFTDPNGSLTWDLGASRSLTCLIVQGDNNDRYTLLGSADGVDFRELWHAEPAPEAGLRLRQGRIDGSARFVRLVASGGDQLFSVAEVAAFDGCPPGWPDLSMPRRGSTSGLRYGRWTLSLVLLAAMAAAMALLGRSRARRRPW
jgi:hypothetical protein